MTLNRCPMDSEEAEAARGKELCEVTQLGRGREGIHTEQADAHPSSKALC